MTFIRNSLASLSAQYPVPGETELNDILNKLNDISMHEAPDL
jgi:hypothetical protein